MQKRYSTVPYSTVQYGTVQYGTVQYGTVGTVHYSTIQYAVNLFLYCDSFSIAYVCDQNFNCKHLQVRDTNFNCKLCLFLLNNVLDSFLGVFVGFWGVEMW